MLAGFSNQFVADSMQCLLEPTCFFPADRLDVLVGLARAALLEVATTLLVLSSPVVEFITRPERARAGDRKIGHAEVNPKNRSVIASLSYITISNPMYLIISQK